MSLKDRIYSDMKTAMKAKDSETLSVLRMIKAVIMNKEIDKGNELDDQEVTKILTTLLKQRRDSAEQFENAGRSELAAKEISEITVVEKYLPQAATDAEIEKAVDAAIAGTGADSIKDMGNVMKSALAGLAGRTVDAKAVSERVRAKLG